MWSLYPPHTYLNLTVKEVPPRLLHRMVNLSRGLQNSCYDLEPPFLRMKSAIPCIYGPDVVATKAKLAFGRWALPKLRHELHSTDPLVVRQALNTVADLVHDPEKCFEAIRLDVIARIQDLLLNYDPLVRERCAMIMTIIGGQAAGREAIMKNPVAVDNLEKLTMDVDDNVRYKAALSIEMVARAWYGADCLIDHDYIPLLFNRLMGEDDEIIVVHLTTLEHMLHRNKVQALQLDAMHMCEYLMEHPMAEVSAGAMSLLALMTSHPAGAQKAIEMDLLPSLNEKLNDERCIVHTKAAAAIMFITITTPSKIKAFELGMIDRLLELAANYCSPELQINSIKALTNLSEVPGGRQILFDQHQDKIKRIDYQDIKHLKRHIRTLLKVVRWKP